ncbi:PREDICTED: probable disease resistance protein At5g66900 [Fragaria vesca subsp. vesca]|uniref:probable disease resistance protein At5g66900 n=1 Tax=Fragaria vesca subsp. vesca TaxID=101020 RepID=UPI0002C30EA5|nr:PREDICTED: probable disease resistance protein At5g66900 [Fragaria vesca subsp. vesca]XP_011464459.1 PREDICTED: probable disease resistance protein At5g66900 [Fragaria vesca subsp. vesca]
MVKFNALEVFVGAGAGGALGPALDVLREVVEKALEFDPTLESVKSTVDSLSPLIPKLEAHNNALGGNRAREVEKLKETMQRGKELIDKLVKISEWSFWKADYTDQLVEWNESLKRHLKILKVQGVCDGMETLVVAKNTSEGVKDTSKDVKVIVTDVKEVLVVTEEHTRLLKDISVTAEENTNKIAGLDAKLEEMMRRNQEMNGLVQNQVKTGWPGVPKPPPFTVGFESQVDELKKKLLEDGVTMALITGHPGAGKTTMAKSVCQDEKVKDKFKIIFVNVSQRPNTEVVQEICEKDGKKLLGFQSEEIALVLLQQLLNNRTGNDPVLLVLDNVWPGNRTRSLLASCKFKESNHKILVTSRSDLPEFDVKHQIEDLNEKDAMSLLRNSAGLTESSSIPEDLQRKVVEFCKRLPLAIEVVGRSLGKEIVIWKDRVEAWSSGSPVIRFQNHVLVCLQSSLDALGEEDTIVDIKECFKDLASFPQGRMIPVSVLNDMWTDKRSSCNAILHYLNNWRLANLVITRNDEGDMDDYVEHFVTQHDLLRELAIHHTDTVPIEQRERLIIDIRGNKFPKWWKKQMDQPFEKAHLVSISTDSHFSSKWRDIQLPKAEVLVLNSHTKNYGLPEFVKEMKKLKVLIVTNGFLPAEVSNFSLLGSLSKLKTIRLERISISSITKNPIELKRLQKISFFMCNMGPAFSKDSIKEAFPELQEINIDYCSDLVELPADICRLIHLKKLSITNCHKLSELPEMIGELVNLELLRLRSCTDLSEFPGSIRKLKKLKVLDISNCYSVKELPEYIGEMCSLENINMRQCSRLDELPESISDLEKLTDVICDEETERLWKPHLPSLRNNINITVVKEKFSLDWLHQYTLET